MDIKLSPIDLELYNHIDSIMFYKWDPIGVSVEEPEWARDEYYMYLPGVFSLVKQGRPAKEIADFLSEIEIKRMHLNPDNIKNLEIARGLIAFSAELQLKK